MSEPGAEETRSIAGRQSASALYGLIIRDAGLRGARLVISTLLAGFLGLAMVSLKILLNH